MVGPPPVLRCSRRPRNSRLAANPSGAIIPPVDGPLARSISGGELLRCLSDQPALEAGGVKLVLAGLTLALPAGDGRRAVRRSTDDLVERHLALIRIRQPDDHHAEVQEVGDACEKGRLLASVLRRGGR